MKENLLKLTPDTVIYFSAQKNEPGWMLDFRLRAFDLFRQLPLPSNSGDLSEINFDRINLQMAITPPASLVSWEAPAGETRSHAGMPSEVQSAANAANIGSSGVKYEMPEEWKTKGVIFLSPEDALKKHEELFREHFASIVSASENKFAALNSAFWSGGAFIYVPEGVVVNVPLQTQMRLSRNMGPFERTLIVVDEGGFVHYVEGCTAPLYSSDLLHAGVVEVVVKRNARCRFTTVQNYSTNVYNIVTKGAFVWRDATMQWVDGNIGGKLTDKRPCVRLKDCGARAELTSIAFAGKGQHTHVGAHVIHEAANTHSHIYNRSVSMKGGRASFTACCSIKEGADSGHSRITCDGLLLDGKSRIDANPRIEVEAENSNTKHETSVRSLGNEQIFYLGSRGLSRGDATKLIVDGFLEPLISELPMEYAVEMKQLIELEMEEVP